MNSQNVRLGTHVGWILSLGIWLHTAALRPRVLQHRHRRAAHRNGITRRLGVLRQASSLGRNLIQGDPFLIRLWKRQAGILTQLTLIVQKVNKITHH